MGSEGGEREGSKGGSEGGGSEGGEREERVRWGVRGERERERRE